ncbi:hypothetical protein Cni_G27351 [Canna indica]|uniref:Uncharacterized protein n=1 Tax=Canna indica TaxID=4628 RepID=A0AAQ3QP84_9LILI|nr:hypothetical protein Cni_G27351 [Canna indica]
MAWQLIEQLTGGPFPAPYYRYLAALLFLALAAARLISSHRFRDLQAYSRMFHLFSGRNRRRFLSIYMEAAAVFFHPIDLFGAAVDGTGSLTGYYWFLGAFLIFVLVEVWFSFPVDGSAWRPMFHFFFIFWALIDVFFRDIESLPREYYSYVGGYLFFVVGCSLLQFLAVDREPFGGEPSGSTGPPPISTTDACYMLSFSFICWALVFLFSHSSPTDYYIYWPDSHLQSCFLLRPVITQLLEPPQEEEDSSQQVQTPNGRKAQRDMQISNPSDV